MAGAGYRDWSPGDVPTANQFDTYLQHQTVMVFADASARNTALSAVLAEGMHAFLLDTNTLTVYSGAAWSTVGPTHGAMISWTPTVTQSGGVSVTNTRSWYQRVGRLITASFYVTVTGSGTASNAITMTLPVTSTADSMTMGSGYIQDVSPVPDDFYPFVAVQSGSASMLFRGVDITGAGGSSVLGSELFIAGLAGGDVIKGTIQYEAAADA